MRIYIDTEFNGFGGELISLALVTENGQEWYECLPYHGKEFNPWVMEHVIPILGKDALAPSEFQASLAEFIGEFDGCEFIGDHPADFTHLCRLMDNISAENDFRIPIECTMMLLRGSPEIAPEVPHNALSDARALRDWHQREMRAGQEVGA